MSHTRDGLNLAALGRMQSKPPPHEKPQPMQVAAAGAGGGSTSAAPSVFTGSIPTEWTGTPGGHDPSRQMRVIIGAGTWGILVEIYSVVDEVETVHATFNITPTITKVCIDSVEVYRCALMDPTAEALA